MAGNSNAWRTMYHLGTGYLRADHVAVVENLPLDQTSNVIM